MAPGDESSHRLRPALLVALCLDTETDRAIWQPFLQVGNMISPVHTSFEMKFDKLEQIKFHFI